MGDEAHPERAGLSQAVEWDVPAGLPTEMGRVLAWIPAAVLVVDASGVVRWANDRALRVLRRPSQGLLGQPAQGLLGVVLPALEALPRGSEGYADRVTLVDAEGHAQVISFRVTPLEGHGAAYRAVFLQDVTGIEHLRAERDRLLQFAAVHEVLPSLLHEVKTPLASVLSSVELLVEDTPAGPLQTSLYALLLELRRMKLNMEGIGSVGRPLRSGRVYPIDEAVTQACHVLEANARGRGIALRAHVALLPLLPFDPSVIRAVVFNLVTNALYACQPGDSVEVSLGLDAAGAQLVLSVRDSGCGMSPETVARCRDLFFTTRSNGSGLGLALCDTAAQAASGSLTVESALAQGTTITLTVPLSVPRAVRPG